MLKVTQKLKLSIPAVVSLFLVACGGGGGGGGPSYVTPTSWTDAIRPNVLVTVTGDSQQGTYSWNSGTNKITSDTYGNVQTGATYTAAYDSNGYANYVRVQTASGTDFTLTTSNSTFGVLRINTAINAIVSNDGTIIALSAEPSRFGWNYQSFGVWATGAGTGSGTAGAASVGWATPGSSVPTSGSATYSGYSGGRYVAADGSYFYTSSTVSANTNFATRSIAFSTSSTQTTSDLINLTNNNGLNMSGTLTYAANSNQFTGSVTTTGGLSGTVTGRFYGPAAQEIGGMFSVSGSGVNLYGGAFGAKR